MLVFSSDSHARLRKGTLASLAHLRLLPRGFTCLLIQPKIRVVVIVELLDEPHRHNPPEVPPSHYAPEPGLHQRRTELRMILLVIVIKGLRASKL